MCKTCTLKTIKHCWQKLKTTYINGDLYYVHGLEGSMLYNVNSLQIDLWFNTIPIKILADIFVELNKIVLKLVWNCKAPRIAKIIWGKRVRKVYHLDDLIARLVIKL